jgi:Holliday junction resolvase-like predicted endonuclease
LRLKGYRIPACRYRVQGGEIDIVTAAPTRRFVEVKVATDEARTAIDFIKRRRIPRGENPARFDLAAPLTWRGDVARHRASALAASRNRGIRTGFGM